MGFRAFAQNFSFSIGTDVPYQYYLGINSELKNIDFSYRTGILTPPYSDVILDIIERLGTDEIYINLLDASYDFGWMNSIGAYYKFGKLKSWYIGSEFRVDYLTASDTPEDLIEAVSGRSFNRSNFNNRGAGLKLGLRTFALGIRFGKSFSLSSNKKHYLKTEFSLAKHIATHSILQSNGNDLERINQELDRLLWDDVFKRYGYLGGFGFAYCYIFK